MKEIDYRKGDWGKNESAVFDGDPYQGIVFSRICTDCSNFRGFEGFAPVCKAFPLGIPPEIWLGKNSHRTPYPGDHGVLFQAAKP